MPAPDVLQALLFLLALLPGPTRLFSFVLFTESFLLLRFPLDFDSFGNLLSKTVTAGSGPSLSVSVNAANNQIQGVSGLSYDANGNQNVGTYDAENRLSTVIN